MDTDNLSGATALVTGAASGIGRATAVEIARRGADLVVCDVDEKGLAETEETIRAVGRDVLARRVDVASADAMRAFADEVHGHVEAVDLLVNNAGVALGANFLDTTLEDWRWIVDINLMGVVHGCHLFVPAMVRRARGGHVVNVSSAAGYFATPSLGAYAATKFGVLGLSQSLAGELRPHGIGVTAVCPGIIDTPITQSAKLRGALAAPGMRERMVSQYQRRNYTPERVARALLRAVARGRVVAPVSPEAWAFWALVRISPRGAAWLSERVRRQLDG